MLELFAALLAAGLQQGEAVLGFFVVALVARDEHGRRPSTALLVELVSVVAALDGDEVGHTIRSGCMLGVASLLLQDLREAGLVGGVHEHSCVPFAIVRALPHPYPG